MTTLREYHERTKHSPASVRANAYALDWENQPIPFKVYPDLDADPLPRSLPGSRHLALEAIDDVAPRPTRPIDVGVLAHLLYFSAGVLKRRAYPGGEVFYRAAACTGALYHVDAYVVGSDIDGLAAGVHHFGPHDFALRTLRAGDHRAHLVGATGDEPHVADAPILLVLTSTFWRNAWKYRTRTYRHCFWDAGTLVANLLAVAAALDISAHVVTGFVDGAVAGLLDVDQAREAPLAVLALGAGGPPVPPAPALLPLGLVTLPLSRTEIDYPLIRDAHTVSSLATATAVKAWRSGGQEAPRASAMRSDVDLEPLPAAAIAEPIENVISRRGSTRRFRRDAISLDHLATILHLATRSPLLDVAAPVELHVIVNAVDGIAPGTYRCDPGGRLLERVRAGDFRETAGHLDLGQELAADAAANLYWLVDLDAVFARLGDRGYRAVQLAAAIAGGRAYLAAYALGLGATGLTFFDDDVTRFLAPSVSGMGVLFLVAIGNAAR